jgi:hypothetical protein
MWDCYLNSPSSSRQKGEFQYQRKIGYCSPEHTLRVKTRSIGIQLGCNLMLPKLRKIAKILLPQQEKGERPSHYDIVAGLQ